HFAMITFTQPHMTNKDLAPLKEGWVLVVGGGQAASATPGLTGNGRAICLTLSRRGARVICADRDIAAAQATVAAIHEEGGQATALQADISQPGEIESLFASVTRQGLSIGGLVLNAGISDRRPLAETTHQSWDAILDVNLRGHMLC